MQQVIIDGKLDTLYPTEFKAFVELEQRMRSEGDLRAHVLYSVLKILWWNDVLEAEISPSPCKAP